MGQIFKRVNDIIFSKKMKYKRNNFALITGAAGLLGQEHSIALLEENYDLIITDVNYSKLIQLKKKYSKKFENTIIVKKIDVSKEKSIINLAKFISKNKIKLSVLINNAALDPKVSKNTKNKNKIEDFESKYFFKEFNVGLLGALFAIKHLGPIISKNKDGGSIINIGSDLSVIAPNQNIYQNGFKKPVSYSIIKHGLLGLTKYISTYWSDKKVRCNMISPGPILQEQPPKLIRNLKKIIPMGRLANKSEYKSAIQFLSSKKTSYITGQNIIIDGGRSVW